MVGRFREVSVYMVIYGIENPTKCYIQTKYMHCSSSGGERLLQQRIDSHHFDTDDACVGLDMQCKGATPTMCLFTNNICLFTTWPREVSQWADGQTGRYAIMTCLAIFMSAMQLYDKPWFQSACATLG